VEQRDLLKDQIEQLGKVLAEILSDFLRLKSKGELSEGFAIANQRLQIELNIDIKKVTTLSQVELKIYLVDRKLTAEHIEVLSYYLKELGLAVIKTDTEKAKLYLEQAISLLDAADDISNMLSFDRIDKKKAIESMLQEELL
jgi:hypothetical protein